MSKYKVYRNFLSEVILVLILISSFVGAQNVPKHYTVGIMKNLFNDVNINDASVICNIWIKALNELNKSKYDLSVKIFDDFNEVQKSENEGKLAVIALNVSDYIKYKNKLKLEPEFIPAYKGATKYRYLMLVREKEKFKSITDLKGASIGITEKYDYTIPGMWLDAVCADNKIPEKEKFFKEIIKTPNESKLILNLFFGKIDACIVPENTFLFMAELNPQIKKRLTILKYSPYYIITVICFTNNFLNKKDREFFQKKALDMQKLVYGQQVLTLMKIDQIVLYHKDDLNSFLQLLKVSKHTSY